MALNRLLDSLAVFLGKLLCGVSNILGPKRAQSVIAWILTLCILKRERFRRTCERNLALVYPDKDKEWQAQFLDRATRAWATVFVDFARLPNLTKEWVQTHVDCSFLAEYERLKALDSQKGILLVGGHLGSFELQAYLMGLLGHPFELIVRAMKLPQLNRWWTTRRTGSGNVVIDRKGAYRRMLANLRAGRDVGLLFDQNLVRAHALFVDWFGRPAATTKALGTAAVTTQARVVLAALIAVAPDRYIMELRPFDFTEIYENQTLSKSEKIFQVTDAVTRAFEGLVKKHPESWFWMHRRWKTTRYESEPETFYEL